MNWLDVQGQTRAMRLLQMAYAGGRMPHAWVFHGPGGVGKEMLARQFARLLLCDAPVEIEPPAEIGASTGPGAVGQWMDACGRCRSCHLIEIDTHPDLRVVHRGLNKFHPDVAIRNRKALDISVDVARHFLLDHVYSRAAMGRAKVFLVLEAELLSTAAQNVLLKTLEEPPDDTYIILISTGRERLLPTINSRCQPVVFGPVDETLTTRILGDKGLAAGDAAFYAALSEGRPGWAMQLAGMDVRRAYGRIAEGLAGVGSADPLQLAEEWHSVAKDWAKVVQAARAEREQPAGGSSEEAAALAAAAGADDTPTDLLRLGLHVLFVVQSHVLRTALRIGASISGQPDRREMDALAAAASELARWGPERLAQAVQQVNDADAAVARNASPPLTLEAQAVKLAQISRGALAASLDQT